METNDASRLNASNVDTAIPNVEFSVHGQVVGRLLFDLSGIRFEGNADEAAQVLIDVLAEKWQSKVKEWIAREVKRPNKEGGE